MIIYRKSVGVFNNSEKRSDFGFKLQQQRTSWSQRIKWMKDSLLSRFLLATFLFYQITCLSHGTQWRKNPSFVGINWIEMGWVGYVSSLVNAMYTIDWHIKGNRVKSNGATILYSFCFGGVFSWQITYSGLV